MWRVIDSQIFWPELKSCVSLAVWISKVKSDKVVLRRVVDAQSVPSHIGLQFLWVERDAVWCEVEVESSKNVGHVRDRRRQTATVRELAWAGKMRQWMQSEKIKWKWESGADLSPARSAALRATRHYRQPIQSWIPTPTLLPLVLLPRADAGGWGREILTVILKPTTNLASVCPQHRAAQKVP